MTTRIEDGLLVFTLDHGVTNALNLDTVEGLVRAVTEAQTDPRIRGLVLRSSNEKFFSIGFDLPRLLPLLRPAFRDFYRLFNETCLSLYSLAKPTAVALTGHAVAGGCILALCCDHRVTADGRKLMGLNEVALGVPVPFLADRALREELGAGKARKILETGELVAPPEALELGLVDRVLPAGGVTGASTRSGSWTSATRMMPAEGSRKHRRSSSPRCNPRPIDPSPACERP